MKQKTKHMHQKGITLLELIIVLAIFTMIVVSLGDFMRNIFVYNRFSSDSLSTAQDARNILKVMVKELRSSSPGSNGAYAIAQAATSSLTFYSDTDGDGLKDKIRYFLAVSTSTSILKKGIIKPVGVSPVTYPIANEIISLLAYNIKNATSADLFSYYNDTYNGTSSPMAQPVQVAQISLIKINLVLDVDPIKDPIPRSYTSQVTLRNLKDNL